MEPVSASITIGSSSGRSATGGLEQLAAERPDRHVDADRRGELRRPRAACDHEDVGSTSSARRVRAHDDAARLREPQRPRAPPPPGRRRRRSGTRRAEHVGDREAGPTDASTRSTGTPSSFWSPRRSSSAARPSSASRGTGSPPAGRATARAAEELDALAREHDFLCRRELLAHAAHRRDVEPPTSSPRVGDDHVVGAEEREVVGDARPRRAGAGDDYPSHSRRCARLRRARRRSGRATAAGRRRAPGRRGDRAPSSRPRGTGAPAARRAARRRERRSRASGRARARRPRRGSWLRARRPRPTAPAARPWGMSASGPTKMSRPSTRYGAKRSQGVSDTFRPAKFGASSRKAAIIAAGPRSRCAPRTRRRRTASGRMRRRLGEVREKLVRVEGEVRRRDHRHRVGTVRCRVLGELDGVGCVLRAAMNGDLQRAAAREEELGDALALRDVEEHALPRRPEARTPSTPCEASKPTYGSKRPRPEPHRRRRAASRRPRGLRGASRRTLSSCVVAHRSGRARGTGAARHARATGAAERLRRGADPRARPGVRRRRQGAGGRARRRRCVVLRRRRRRLDARLRRPLLRRERRRRERAAADVRGDRRLPGARGRARAGSRARRRRRPRRLLPTSRSPRATPSSRSRRSSSGSSRP